MDIPFERPASHPSLLRCTAFFAAVGARAEQYASCYWCWEISCIHCATWPYRTILLASCSREINIRDVTQRQLNGNIAKRPPYWRPCSFAKYSIYTAPMTALNTVVTTISFTEQPRDKSYAGRASPCTTGPNASAPPSRSVILYAILPD